MGSHRGIKESHTECSTGTPCSCARGCARGCVRGCACGCARAVLSDPCRGSWLWGHPECYFEWPLSRIVALEPSGKPFGATPVEDRGFGAVRDAIWSDCRGSWLWSHPGSHLERPLSKFVASEPSGRPFGLLMRAHHSHECFEVAH